MASNEVKTQKLTAKDFASNQEVRWCPGCGDYSILAQVQRSFPDIIETPKENVVWVSGIGCSSRFPYYMDTYGIHGIHGRATTIATGVKVANPELSVWVATGDGDLLSIGGNHFIHSCRKNVDIKVLLFNNRIYGLTKGQYSPTSEKGKVTKTTPFGSIDYPFDPVALALGADATFVARSLDRSPKHLQEMLKSAGKHSGMAFIEIFQNCNIFNDGAFSILTDKETKEDHLLMLEHDKPMVFGKNLDKGIKLDGLKPVVVDISNGKYSKDDLWVHNEFDESPVAATILAEMDYLQGFPTPIGVFRQYTKETYDRGIKTQIDTITKNRGKGDLEKTLYGPNTWEVN